MKRTVTRWVSKARQADLQYAEIHSEKTAHFCVPVEVTGDDGQPEPERCPCDSEDSCCQYRSVNSECCSCHRGSPLKHVAPCFSPFHKKAAYHTCVFKYGETGCEKCGRRLADVDRVVEGYCAEYKSGGFSFDVPCKRAGFPPTWNGKSTPATLIIHEPVRDMGLYEAVEAFTKNYKTFVNGVAGWDAIIDALNRERAARERGSK